MNVLSLFDGISCGRVALERAGVTVDNYFASEIDQYAMKISNKNYPDIVQLGDINNWKSWKLPEIDLIMGGSPCQGFSNAGKGLNFEDPRSKLFFVFVDIIEHYKPKNFLFENVKMKKEWENIISEYLGVKPILIDSALVSAQSRARLYWTNILIINQPQDKCLIVKDILEKNVDEHFFLTEYDLRNYVSYETSKNKTKLIQVGSIYAKNADAGRIYSINGKARTLKGESGGMGGKMGIYVVRNVYRKHGQNGNVYSADGKSKTLSAGVGIIGRGIGSSNAPKILYNDRIRRLTPVECERLQNVFDNYTFGVSDTQRYKMLGNGWTVDVIAHILGFMAKQ